MQAFDALIAGQRAGSARGTGSDASRASGVQDNANASGGFDRMLQAQGPRDGASNPASRMTQSPSPRTSEAKPRDADQPHGPDETKPSGTKTKDDARETSRSESKDQAPRESDAPADDADTAATACADETPATGETTATASTITTNDAATPALPEQMLALLNGLAGANTAPAATAPASTEALPPGLLRGDPVATSAEARAGNAAAPVLPAMAGTQPAAAASTDGDATAAFAMAMGAAAPADATTADADAALDTTAIGDTAPTAPPSISTMTNHPLPRAAAAAIQANAPIAMDDGFDDGFSSRIAWMADQKVGHAEIRVTPDHLGAIDVRLQLDGNRVNAEFHSAQPDVRHALESSLPRLKEMLGQQGLQLGQADVGQRHAQPQGSNSQAATLAGGSERSDSGNDAGWTRGPSVRASRGLLDEYA